MMMTARTYFRKKRSCLYMAGATILLFIGLMLIYSMATTADIPRTQGMTEDQILTAYAKQIKAEAKYRAWQQSVATKGGMIE